MNGRRSSSISLPSSVACGPLSVAVGQPGAGEGGAGFALLCDCHIEVEEDFELVDLETGEVVAAESGSRDHIWTFMAPIASVADTELEWTLRDMNHFVSMGGVVSSDTVRKLSPPD